MTAYGSLTRNRDSQGTEERSDGHLVIASALQHGDALRQGPRRRQLVCVDPADLDWLPGQVDIADALAGAEHGEDLIDWDRSAWTAHGLMCANHRLPLRTARPRQPQVPRQCIATGVGETLPFTIREMREGWIPVFRLTAYWPPARSIPSFSRVRFTPCLLNLGPATCGP